MRPRCWLSVVPSAYSQQHFLEHSAPLARKFAAQQVMHRASRLDMFVTSHSTLPISCWVPMIANFDGFTATRHFSALDGLRAFSVLGVIWHHTSGNPGPDFLSKGYLGVDFFFAISGFLITTLLLRERRSTGRISLRKFYARRSLRIFPIYYAVLAAYVVLTLVLRRGTTEGETFFGNLLAFATYTSNWFVDLTQGESVTFYFAWSLATEEQFYLFWPPLLVGLLFLWPRRTAPAVITLAALILLDQLATMFADTSILGWRILASLSLPILLAAGGAVALNTARGFRLVASVLGHRWSAPAIFSLLVLSLFVDSPRQIPQILMVAAVISVTINETTPVHPFFSWRPLAFVGTISYGMYLMHMLSANALRLVLDQHTGVALFVATAALTVVVAYLSYRFFESPLLRLKRRFEVSSTASASRAASQPRT